ncbi:hypothetical protein ACOMHN_033266 [Nucella lapillus]
MTLSQLENAEKLFRVNVDIFEYDESQSPPCLVPTRRSERKYASAMTILNYDHHFCYIMDIDKAAHAFACPQCGKLWKKNGFFNVTNPPAVALSSKKSIPEAFIDLPRLPCSC